MSRDEVSSGSSVSIGDPHVQALLEALAKGQLVAKPTIGLSEAQRFNGSHYTTWRLKFIRRAEEVGLWSFYHPDQETKEGVPPIETEPPEKIAVYKKQSKQAFFQLCHSVADSIAVGLDDFAGELNSAQLAWEYMESAYMGVTDADKSAERKKLLLLSMEKNERVIDYINRAKSYNDNLRAMGAPEKEREMIGYIVEGLPKEWESDIHMFTYSPPASMTKLVEALQALERVRATRKLKEATAKGVEEEKPAIVNATAAARRVFGECYHCEKKGHKALDCYDNPRSRNFRGKAGYGGGGNSNGGAGGGGNGVTWQQRRGFGGNCNYCRKFGHKAIECYANPNSMSYRGQQQVHLQQQQQQRAPAAKVNTVEAEKRDEDVILGGSHKANVAMASAVCLLAKGLEETAWFMDSGCTQHMTNRSEWLRGLRESCVPYVLVGDEGKLTVKGEGDVVLQGPYGELKLERVLLVESLALNLISQSQLDGMGCKTLSDQGKMWVFGSDWKVIAEGRRNQGLYEMKLREKVMSGAKVTYQPEPEEGVMAREELMAKVKLPGGKEKGIMAMAAAAEKVEIGTMHRRMGHASMERVKEVVQKEMVKGVVLKDGEKDKGKCYKCIEGKQTRASHPKHKVEEEGYGVMEIVAADVCGPMRVPSRHGSRYFVTFTDLGTRHTWVTEMKEKGEVFGCFKEWKAEAERQSRKKLKVLRTDNGGEFMSKDFSNYLKSKEIRRQLTVPYTPQHNSIAERVNRSLLDSVRSMLADSGLPLRFWGDALGMACWAKNRLPTKGLAADMTPHEAFYGRKPNLQFARVWGCMVQYREPNGPDHKLLPRTKWGINLGICPVSKGWVIKDVENGSVVATRDVIFYESVNYLEWKGVDKDMSSTTGELAAPSAIEEMMEEHAKEGIGAADEDEESGMRTDQPGMTAEWVWEKLPSEAEEIPEIVQHDGDEEVEIEQQQERARESVTEDNDPWHLLESEDSDEAARKIGELLEDGAVVIGREAADSETDNEENGAEVSKASGGTAAEELGRGKRVKKRNAKYVQLLMTCWKNVHTHLLLTVSATALVSKATREKYNLPSEPVTVEEALSGPHSKQWRAAIQEELDTLAERGAWELARMPVGRNAVGVKWIFKIKTGDFGQLERFKARLVAKGYTQVEGEDYNETYAPVSKLTTARGLLKVIAARGYFLVQLDIKNAFLYGVLKEETYMDQPPGFEDGTDRKCKLIRALYGLKQSPREWYKVMDERLMKGGFTKSECDRAFYWKGEGKQKVFLLFYVDDILVTGAVKEEVEKVCAHLAEVFQVKQIPRATLFLGMNLERNEGEKKLFLYQQKYCQRLQQRFGGNYTKAIATPLSGAAEQDGEREEDAIKWGSEKKALKAYQSRVGSVMYPVSCTRVDMAFAASYLGQKVQQPEGRKWREMDRSISYLLQHEKEGLLFEGGEETLELVGYADASHASDKETRRGAFGYVYLLGGTAIMWQAKKLADIALSSAEAEYMALFYACQEGVWLRRLLKELDIEVKGPTVIRTDSTSAIDLARNDNWHGRTKHMDVKYHWVREQLEKKTFTFEHVRTEEQAADFLTKNLPRVNFEHCKELVGIRTIAALQGSEGHKKKT